MPSGYATIGTGADSGSSDKRFLPRAFDDEQTRNKF